MIHYQPLEEIWYMTETKNELLVSVLRYQMKKGQEGTILTVRFEVEEPQDPFFKSIAEAINLQANMVKGTEQGTAMIQAYFNKSLKVEELLEKGLRGEFYVTFFSANKLSAYINAEPQKVHKYITNPETWAKWEQEYKIYNLGPCLTSQESGACQAQINLGGVDYKMNFFSASYEPDKYMSSYFTSPVAGVGRIQIFLKPKDKGTALSIKYMIQVSQFSPGGTEFLLNLSQLPQIIEQMILDVKNNSEQAGKI